MAAHCPLLLVATLVAALCSTSMSAPSSASHRMEKRAPRPFHLKIKPLHIHIKPHIDVAKKVKLEKCILQRAKHAPGKALHIMIGCVPKALAGGAPAFGTCCAISGAISAAVAISHVVACMK